MSIINVSKYQIKKSTNYTEKMLGLGKDVWKDIDPLEYIQKERANWDKKMVILRRQPKNLSRM